MEQCIFLICQVQVDNKKRVIALHMQLYFLNFSSIQ